MRCAWIPAGARWLIGALEGLVAIDLLVPMQPTQACLRPLPAPGYGRIGNVGSTFGSTGFTFFAAHSASRFGLRGYSQALRRARRAQCSTRAGWCA